MVLSVLSAMQQEVLYLDVVLSNINGSVGVLLVADFEEALLFTCCPKAVVG